MVWNQLQANLNIRLENCWVFYWGERAQTQTVEGELYHHLALFYFLCFLIRRSRLKLPGHWSSFGPTHSTNGPECVCVCVSWNTWRSLCLCVNTFKCVCTHQLTGRVISQVRLIDLVVWGRVSCRLPTLGALWLWAVMDVSESPLHKPAEKPTKPCEPRWTTRALLVFIYKGLSGSDHQQTAI